MTSSVSSPSSRTVIDIIANRRSVYYLSNKCPLSDAQLEQLVKDALHHCPTPFNCQSTRAVLVTGEAHVKMWAAMWEVRRKSMQSAEHETKAKEKWDRAYAAGYGTVVFYEDPAAVEAKLGHKPGDVFEAWTKNAQGMLQFTIWNALELEGGMGANLQHFHQEDPNVAAAIRELLKIPARWEPSAMIPFGVKTAPAGDRTYVPVEERFLSFKTV